MKRIVIALFVAILCASTIAHAETDPSFSCARASTRVEKLICSDKKAALLDRQLSQLYAHLRKTYFTNSDVLTDDQKVWLKKRRDICGDTACLRRAYQERLATLKRQKTDLSRTMSILKKQGFSSVLDDGGVSISKVCSMHVSGSRYDFYYYIHVDPRPVLSKHAITALIEIKDGKTFVGRYSMMWIEPSCDQRTKQVLFKNDSGHIDRATVSSNGLPFRIHVDGENPERWK